MLKRIMDVIPMSLAEFSSLQPAVPKKAFYRKDGMVEMGKGAISFRSVRPRFGRAPQIAKERYQPGADTRMV